MRKSLLTKNKILIIKFTFILFTLPIFSKSQSLTIEEKKLYDLIMKYRIDNGLSKIPLSASLTFVAQTHVKDLAENIGYLTHAWSNCRYIDSDKETFKCMWLKPRELTKYKGYGYECAHGGSGGYLASAESAFNGWKNSFPHNAVILNQGIWNDNNWRAIGIGIYKGYAAIWFGEDFDNYSTTNLNSSSYPISKNVNSGNSNNLITSNNISTKKKENNSKSFHQKTSLNPFISVLTVPELDLQKITKSSAFYFGAELEIPFDEDKKLYTAFYSKTGAFLFQPSSTLQNSIGFFGLKNSEGFSITPFQEIGFVFFKHLKLGAGTHFARHSSFKYQPYYFGGFGFQMDEYEIEIGSLAQNISNTWQFYPSISLKIRPKP